MQRSRSGGRLGALKTVVAIDVGSRPMDLAVGAGAIWVSVWDDAKVVRVDPATNAVVRSIRVPSPDALAFARDALWVASSENSQIVQILLPSLTQKDTLSVGPAPISVQYAAAALWVTYNDFGHGDGDDPDPSILSRIALPNEATP
jgi:virginiamycin B lyase